MSSSTTNSSARALRRQQLVAVAAARRQVNVEKPSMQARRLEKAYKAWMKYMQVRSGFLVVLNVFPPTPEQWSANVKCVMNYLLLLRQCRLLFLLRLAARREKKRRTCMQLCLLRYKERRDKELQFCLDQWNAYDEVLRSNAPSLDRFVGLHIAQHDRMSIVKLARVQYCKKVLRSIRNRTNTDNMVRRQFYDTLAARVTSNLVLYPYRVVRILLDILLFVRHPHRPFYEEMFVGDLVFFSIRYYFNKLPKELQRKEESPVAHFARYRYRTKPPTEDALLDSVPRYCSLAITNPNSFQPHYTPGPIHSVEAPLRTAKSAASLKTDEGSDKDEEEEEEDETDIIDLNSSVSRGNKNTDVDHGDEDKSIIDDSIADFKEMSSPTLFNPITSAQSKLRKRVSVVGSIGSLKSVRKQLLSKSNFSNGGGIYQEQAPSFRKGVKKTVSIAINEKRYGGRSAGTSQSTIDPVMGAKLSAVIDKFNLFNKEKRCSTPSKPPTSPGYQETPPRPHRRLNTPHFTYYVGDVPYVINDFRVGVCPLNARGGSKNDNSVGHSGHNPFPPCRSDSVSFEERCMPLTLPVEQPIIHLRSSRIQRIVRNKHVEM